MGVLAGTHWGDDSSKVMRQQSANPLWLCHGHDRGGELPCGLVMLTTFIHAFFTHTSSARESLAVKLTSCFSLNWCSRVSSTAPLAFMWMFVFVSLSFSGFVACVAIVQVLCGLTHHPLELRRLEICVTLQVFLSAKFTTLYILVMSCISTLSWYELVLEFCVGASDREAVILHGTSCALVVSGIRIVPRLCSH